MGKGGESVEDERIVELFNRRDELAIAAAEEKYGAYCRSIAQNTFHSFQNMVKFALRVLICVTHTRQQF